MQSSSKLIENAVDQLSSLPGIGRKTAFRLVLNLLNRDMGDIERFSNAFTDLKGNIKFCIECFNLSDNEKCNVCSNMHRDKSVICVVEDIRDIMAVESTQQYQGVYHVLGGKISPMDGIGPADLKINELIGRIERAGNVTEIIMALSPTLEGDTTAFYLYKKLGNQGILMTTIAKGISVGNELEYTDEVTLGRSILDRKPFEDPVLG
ncbi:MAG: recombination protein RecR [Flavobacteriales bacterium]|nr:recombination protein RecR [Flavobacteriales bacterium]